MRRSNRPCPHYSSLPNEADRTERSHCCRPNLVARYHEDAADEVRGERDRNRRVLDDELLLCWPRQVYLRANRRRAARLIVRAAGAAALSSNRRRVLSAQEPAGVSGLRAESGVGPTAKCQI